MDEKMIKVKDVLSFIEEKAPASLAEAWDNVGLLVGDLEKQVKRVFVALDICEATLDEAIALEADLFLTHHPFIFSGMKRILADDVKGNQVIKLISNGISVISEHTNEDCSDTGLNVYLAKILGVQKAEVFEDTTFLRVGELAEEIDVTDFAKTVKQQLDINTICMTNVFVYENKLIRKVGVFTGKVDLNEVLAHKEDFDVLVCGELGYHSALTLVDEGVLAFECGHYGSENIFRRMMKEMLLERFPMLDIRSSQSNADPYKEI